MIYQMKIRDRFIDFIKTGTKKHEYRLATDERKKINVGDVLILVSNDNKNNNIKVIVEEVNIYSSWDEALCNNWKQDFANQFSTIEEVKKECYKFYSRDLVESKGIIVFKISVFKNVFNAFNVLLDTNIVIHRESTNNVSYEVIKLFKILDDLKANKFVDSSVVDELNKYKDETVKNAMKMKIKTYGMLISNFSFDTTFESVVSRYSLDDNSKIDNQVLYQVYSGHADYLITNDKCLLRKAKELFIEDQVYSAYDFLRKIEKVFPSLIDYPVLSIKLTRIGDINYNDHFFDSLREDYQGVKFNDWFKKKSNENAYVFKINAEIQGFLYLKIEDGDYYPDITPLFSVGRRLKIGTFKINSTGMRVGERFLKIIFDFALKANVEEIYVTLFEDKRDEVKTLMQLLMRWGFIKFGRKTSTGELVLVKNMIEYNYHESVKFNYPLTMSDPNYGVLPIDSSYHTDLFPDLFLKNEDMSLYVEKPCGYAIEKVYVCGYNNRSLKPGDLLVIYRMGERWPKKYTSVISGYCVLEEILTPNSLNDFLEKCKNKTVFTTQELHNFYHERNYKTIIKVLYLKPLLTKVTLNDLQCNGIVPSGEGLRLTSSLSKEEFKAIIRFGEE